MSALTKAVDAKLISTSIAATEIRVPNAVCKTEEERQVLRTNLVHYSNKCVAFCDSLDTLNDISMIFLYESFLLASMFYGDQSTCAAMISFLDNGPV